MAGHEAVRGPGEAPVGDQRHRLPQPLADERGGDGEHLAHAGSARGPLAADHDHVAGLDLAGEHGRHRRLLALEHASRARVQAALVAGQLDDAAIGREVAVQDREPARRFERPGQRAHDLLALGLLRLGGVLADRATGDGGASPWSTPASCMRLSTSGTPPAS